METRRIKTKEDAAKIARRWALQEGANHRQIAEFGMALINDGPLNEDDFLDRIREFHGYAAGAKLRWEKGAQEEWRLHTEWAIETIKHLAIFNAGGLAGCAALLATHRALNDCAIRVGLGSFCIGLFCAVLTFWLGGTAYAKRYREKNARIKECAMAKSWPEIFEADRDYKDPGAMWTKVGIGTARASASMAILGVILTAVALLSAPAPSPLEISRILLEQVIP